MIVYIFYQVVLIPFLQTGIFKYSFINAYFRKHIQKEKSLDIKKEVICCRFPITLNLFALALRIAASHLHKTLCQHNTFSYKLYLPLAVLHIFLYQRAPQPNLPFTIQIKT